MMFNSKELTHEEFVYGVLKVSHVDTVCTFIGRLQGRLVHNRADVCS